MGKVPWSSKIFDVGQREGVPKWRDERLLSVPRHQVHHHRLILPSSELLRGERAPDSGQGPGEDDHCRPQPEATGGPSLGDTGCQHSTECKWLHPFPAGLWKTPQASDPC